jgi:hypothetical protein
MSRQALELEGWEECGIWGGDGPAGSHVAQSVPQR